MQRQIEFRTTWIFSEWVLAIWCSRILLKHMKIHLMRACLWLPNAQESKSCSSSSAKTQGNLSLTTWRTDEQSAVTIIPLALGTPVVFMTHWRHCSLIMHTFLTLFDTLIRPPLSLVQSSFIGRSLCLETNEELQRSHLIILLTYRKSKDIKVPLDYCWKV
jgi:hypothetical protein